MADQTLTLVQAKLSNRASSAGWVGVVKWNMIGDVGATRRCEFSEFEAPCFHQHLFVGRLPIVTDHENTMSYQSHSDLYYEV